MICDQLLTVGITHGAKGVVLALEVTGEGAQSRDDLGLNFTALLSGDGGSEGVIGEVTSHADSGRVDHLILISGEIRALQLGCIHVGDVLVRWGVGVIVLDDLVEKRSKGVEALVATCIDTNA